VIDRPSVLAVTSEVPWPLNSGGHLRTFHLLRTLTRRFDVRLVAPTLGNDEAGGRARTCGRHAALVPVSPRRHLSETVKVAMSAVRREPYVLFARHRRRAVWRALAAEAARRRPEVLYSIISIRSSTRTPCPDVPVRDRPAQTCIRAWRTAPPTRCRAAYAAATLPARTAACRAGARRHT